MDPTKSSQHDTPFRPRSSSSDGENRLQTQILNISGAGGSMQRSTPGSAPMLRASPYSPFPFGLPIQSSNRSLLSPGSLEQQQGNTIENVGVKPNENVITGSGLHVFRGRVRAQDVYGGNVYCNGTPSPPVFVLNSTYFQYVVFASKPGV